MDTATGIDDPASLCERLESLAAAVAERLEVEVDLIRHVHRLIHPLMRLQSFRRDDLLLRLGAPCRSAWLVLDGIARHWLMTPKGHEVTLRFTPESFWAGSFEDMLGGLRGTASTTGISATTPLVVATGRLEELFPTVARDARGACYIDALTRYNFRVRSERERELAALDAAERLAKFSAEQPGMVARLTGRDLAAYLGITPQYLSQLRSRAQRSEPGALKQVSRGDVAHMPAAQTQVDSTS